MERSISICVSLVGFMVLWAWRYDLDVWLSILPGSVTMKPVTALNLILASAILYSFRIEDKRKSTLKEWLLSASTAFLTLSTFMTNVLHITGVYTGFEGMLPLGGDNPVFTVVPGEPSIGTTSCFMTIAFIGYVAFFHTRYRMFIIRWCSTLVFLLSSAAVTGHCLSIPLMFYYIPGVSTGMAIHTALALQLLSLGFYLSVKKEGLKNEKKSIADIAVYPGDN